MIFLQIDLNKRLYFKFRNFFQKHRSAIEKGRSLCKTSGNFNPDPNGPAMTFDGMYFPDDGPVGKLQDYQKCVYATKDIYISWSEANEACKVRDLHWND